MTRSTRQCTRWVITFASCVYILVFLLVYVNLHSAKQKDFTFLRGLYDEPISTRNSAELNVRNSVAASIYHTDIMSDIAPHVNHVINASGLDTAPTNHVPRDIINGNHHSNLSHDTKNYTQYVQRNRTDLNEVAKSTSQLLVLSTPRKVTLPVLDELSLWRKNKRIFCNNLVQITMSLVPTFTNITLDPTAYNGSSKTADVSEVLGQSSSREYIILKSGFYSINCNAIEFKRNYYINYAPEHFTSWIHAFIFEEQTTEPYDRLYNSVYTIALVRNEYANVYWTLMDLYDTYLTATLNNIPIKQTSVLIMDAHPRGHLDKLWTNSFHSVIHPYDLAQKTTFQKMSWLFSRDRSPMLTQSKSVPPMWLKFRTAMLNGNGIDDDHVRNCSLVRVRRMTDNRLISGPRLKVLLIWRRDYIAHPRNPSGLIMRKIKNEAQIERVLKQTYPSYTIRGVQLDNLAIEEQLYLISHSDILIGMHGAAMAFTVFMPPRSAVIEMYPKYYSGYNWHMEYVAKWTGHRFTTWKNTNGTLEDQKKGYTVVPPQVVTNLVEKSTKFLCPS